MSGNRRRAPFRQKPLKIVIEQSNGGLKSGFFALVKRFFMGLGVVFFFFLTLYTFLIVSLLNEAKPTLPEQMILAHHFYGDIEEVKAGSPFSFAAATQPTLDDLIESLDVAKDDPRVKGFVARISNTSYSMAQLYDIKDAIKRFRESGKFAVVFADSFGESGYGMDEYLLASSFDEIWLQPIGSVGINGFHAETLFARDLLDRFLIKPEFFQREDYKSAMEMFTRNEMSPEAKQELTRMIDQISDYYIESVADARNQTKNQIDEAINRAPLRAEDALKMGLIDHIGYSDQLLKKVKEDTELEEEKSFVTIAKYASANKSLLESEQLDDVMGKNEGKKKVARIVMEGPIISGSMMEEGYSPFSNRKVIYSRDFARAITKAANDEDVKALFVRINSPGGSPVASETIRRALVYAKEVKGKPVILSMAGVAASGGYWIASAADKIYATPATITGSIGVISGKFSYGEALAQYGIYDDSVSYGENADYLSPSQPFDAVGRAKINEMLDDIYDGFLERVAEGRNMDKEAVKKIAGGRIWTGMAAKENGLVDEIGGLRDVKTGLSVMLEVMPEEIVYVDYPKHKNPIEQFVTMLNGEWTFLPYSLSAKINEIYTHWQLNQQSAVQVLYDGQLRP